MQFKENLIFLFLFTKKEKKIFSEINYKLFLFFIGVFSLLTFNVNSLPTINEKIFPKEITYIKPTITEDAVVYLESLLNIISNAKVLEFGSGGSTIWLAQYTNQVVSVEHNLEWFEIVTFSLEKKNLRDHVDYYLLPMPYASICDRFPDEYFDLIIVDGRNRMRCLNAAIRVLKRGGTILLDDAQRPYYSYALRKLKRWNREKTYQKNPDPIFNDEMRHTYWWIKP